MAQAPIASICLETVEEDWHENRQFDLDISRHDTWIWANTRKGYLGHKWSRCRQLFDEKRSARPLGISRYRPTVRAHLLKLLNRRIRNRTYDGVRGR